MNSVRAHNVLWPTLIALLSAAGCGGDDENEPEPTPLGGVCQDQEEPECEASLRCEPRADGDEFVCARPLVFTGTLKDALSEEPLADALVIVVDATGTPVAQAQTDASGNYEASVSVARESDGSVPEDAAWTISAAAQAYQPFPYGARTAVPISANQIDEQDGELTVSDENTDVVLLPLPDASDLVQLSGKASAKAAGALVVAEGDVVPAPFGMVGPKGTFTIFNVPKGEVTVQGYRQGVAFAPLPLTVEASVEELALATTDEGLGQVSGSVNIVNAPGGSLTSVVLVPQSVFDPISQKGPVPLALRAPGAPAKPSISGSFEFADVSPGEYVVLAAFENDNLVRDPDTSIGGTQLQTVVVDGSTVALDQSFKVTEHLAVEFPGKDGVEEVGLPLEFKWADDSSEDYYHFVLRSALGDLIWEQAMVPGVSGDDLVTLPYAGPELLTGMFYQFQVTSIRESKGEATPISRSEDLRGAFRVR